VAAGVPYSPRFPLPDVDGAIAELEYALTTLELEFGALKESSGTAGTLPMGLKLAVAVQLFEHETARAWAPAPDDRPGASARAVRESEGRLAAVHEVVVSGDPLTAV
jgi:hypothetical protein